MWPLLIWSNSLNLPLIGLERTLEGFALWAIVPVAISVYLLRSERVHVTYRWRSSGVR